MENKTERKKVTFSKEKILSSKKYKHRADLLGVLLKDGESYTFEDVDNLLNVFMKGKVK